MKNSTYAYTFSVGLTITHPTRELSYLADKLNKIPNGTAGKELGKDWDNNKPVIYNEIKTSVLGFDLNYGWHNALFEEDMPEAIEKLVDAVQPYKEQLLDLVDSGGTITCNIGWHIDSNIGASLNPQLLQKLADLKISLDVSVYMSDEQQDKHVAQIDRMAEKIRVVLHKYDPSGIIDKSVPLAELHHDPYQDLFDLVPYFIKGRASKDLLIEQLKVELGYFNRTNTSKLMEFHDYEALASELLELKWG